MPALDWRVLAFVAAVSCVTGIVFGIAPALRGTGMNVSSALKETGRSVIGSRSVLGKSLLIVQVAISLVLLIGSGSSCARSATCGTWTSGSIPRTCCCSASTRN